MIRGTGGNRFIEADADRDALVAAIDRGLRQLEEWVADDPPRSFDPGQITVDTKRIAGGKISVSVEGDFIATQETTPDEPGQVVVTNAACLAAWPECWPGDYDPRCCRFPKSCSADTGATR